MTNDKHPFKCLSAICLYLVKCLFMYFAHFSFGLFVFLLLSFVWFCFSYYWVLKVLSVSWVQVLCQRFCKYFLWGCDLPFRSHYGDFQKSRGFTFSWSLVDQFFFHGSFIFSLKSWPKFATILPFSNRSFTVLAFLLHFCV